MNIMEIGYICTNYNNTHYTVDAVRSLVESAKGRFKLRAIIVDNKSNAECVLQLQELKNEFSCVDLILESENLGYFKGLNSGIRYLRKNYPNVQLAVIGNNDLIFPPEFCDSIYGQRSIFEEHAVVSPDILTLDGEHQNPHVIAKISRARELVYDIYYSNYLLAFAIRWLASATRKFTDRKDEEQYAKPQEIYQGHGSCYLIGPKFFKHFNELWAPSFMMGEEYFLSKQLSDAGMKTYYTPNIKLRHCCNGSLASLPSRKSWEFGRDAHKIYRKHIKVFG